MPEVLCVGQAVVDCITRGKEATPYRENVYRADTIRLHTGGDAVNEAKTLVSMGIETGVVCCLGKDMAGDVIFRELSEAGVDTGRISRLPVDTPIANLQVARDGSRISVNSEAVQLHGYRVNPDTLAGAKIISFASLFRPPLAEAESVKQLIRRAKNEGAIVCADTKLPVHAAVGTAEIAEVLPLIDYFFPNEKEGTYYTGKKTYPEMAAAFRGMGIRNVIIKTGPDGCYVSGEEGAFSLPAVPVSRVMDTTGAGDHFVAGFISGILAGDALVRCAQRGLQKAAECISVIGGN